MLTPRDTPPTRTLLATLRNALLPALLPALLLALVASVGLAPTAGAAAAPTAVDPAAARRGPIEALATYDPMTRCAPRVKPGTAVLGRWIVNRWGGGGGASWRPCSGGVSEHEDGRAIDWTLDARDPADAARAAALLTYLTAPDAQGNPAAKARRMGVMYLIWDDVMYPAWTGFAPQPYTSASCTTLPDPTTCSATLRHRDHVHLSLSRAGAKGRTSWYAGRLARR